MKKNLFRIAFVIAFGLAPSMAHATFMDCRAAGGSWLGCFYEAAMNDQIMEPAGDSSCTFSKKKCMSIQVKKSFERNKKACKSVASKDQMRCLSRGMKTRKKLTVNKRVLKKGIVSRTQIKRTQIKSN